MNVTNFRVENLVSIKALVLLKIRIDDPSARKSRINSKFKEKNLSFLGPRILSEGNGDLSHRSKHPHIVSFYCKKTFHSDAVAIIGW